MKIFFFNMQNYSLFYGGFDGQYRFSEKKSRRKVPDLSQKVPLLIPSCLESVLAREDKQLVLRHAG